MPLIKALAHVSIKTSDLEKTTAFYCGTLGMEKLFDFTCKGNVIGFYIKASHDTFIEVFQDDKTTPPTTPQNPHHFCLLTENIEQVRQILQNVGYAPGDIKTGADHSLQFWIKDPSGVDVEFHQYSEQSAQLTKQNVEVNW